MTGKLSDNISKDAEMIFSKLDAMGGSGDKAPCSSPALSDEYVDILKNLSISQPSEVVDASHEYLEQLGNDKKALKDAPGIPFRHVNKLLDREINRVLGDLKSQLSSSDASADEALGERITLSHTVDVPVDKYPGYNFVGRLLGPRGMTVKQMEEETGCRIMLRGRGSSRFEQGRVRRERGSEKEPLHILIQCDDYAARAHAKMDRAKGALEQLLNPPPEGKDELKRKQLIELSIINGTYRPTAATKVALQMPRPLYGAHLSSSMDHMQTNDSSKLISMLMNRQGNQQHQKCDSYGPSQPVPNYMYGLMNPLQTSSMNSAALFAEYYKNLQLLSMSLADPNMMSALLAASQYSDPMAPSGGSQAGQIPQAGMKEYLDAAALLNAMPFGHDGAGDVQKKHR